MLTKFRLRNKMIYSKPKKRKEKKKMENYIPKEEAKGYIVIDVDTSQVVEATKKTKKLLKLLKKANSLADELASKEILLNIDVQC